MLNLNDNKMNRLMKNIKKIICALAITCALVTLFSTNLFAGNNDNKEVKVKPEDCPKAVLKAIKDTTKDGKIIEIEKEIKKDGSVVYEAEVKMSNGKKIEIKVSADGKVIKIENEDDEDESADDDKDK